MNSHCHAFIAIVLAAAGLALAACTENRVEYTIQRDTIQGLPSVIATGEVRGEVKVQAIDYANRSVALTGKDGVTHIYTVRADAKRFNEVKVGDVVKVHYSNRLAIAVQRINEKPSISVTELEMPADKSHKPGMYCTRTARVVANVESIDYHTRVVKLRPASGDVFTLNASEQLKGFENVHVGDQVAIQFFESVAIAVD